MKFEDIKKSVENVTVDDVLDVAKTVVKGTVTVACKTITCLAQSLLEVVEDSKKSKD